MRRTILTAFVLLLSWSAAANVEAADKLSYQLGWLPGGDKAPVYLAIQKGLFAAENLEVTVASGRGSEDVLTKLATDVYEVGEVSFDALLNRTAAGNTLVVGLMPFYSKQPDALITTSTSGIKTLKDVKGRTVGSSMFTSSNLMWPVILAANGIELDSVKLLKVDANTLTPMLATGRIDAMINWLPAAAVASRMLSEGGKSVTVLPWSEYGFEGYSQSLAVSAKTLKEKPDAVRRFVKVMRLAIDMTAKDQAAAADAVKAAVPQANYDDVRAQIAAAVALMVNEHTAKDGIGVFEATRVRKTWEWVAKAGNIPVDKIDPMTAIAAEMRPR